MPIWNSFTTMPELKAHSFRFSIRTKCEKVEVGISVANWKLQKLQCVYSVLISSITKRTIRQTCCKEGGNSYNSPIEGTTDIHASLGFN